MSTGVAAPGPVLQVSVRRRLVAPARFLRLLCRGIAGARRLLTFALLAIVASTELCCLLVGQGVLAFLCEPHRNATSSKRAGRTGSPRSTPASPARLQKLDPSDPGLHAANHVT